MNKPFLSLFGALILSATSASAIEYKLDYSKLDIEDVETAQEECKQSFKIESASKLPSQVMAQLYANSLSAENIEVNTGTLEDEEDQPYTGEYKTSVFLVKEKPYASAYRPFILSRVEIVQFANGFTIDIEPVNFRDSAEIAEGSVCRSLHFKK